MKYPSFKEGIGISLISIVMFSLVFLTDTPNDNEVTGNIVKVTGMASYGITWRQGTTDNELGNKKTGMYSHPATRKPKAGDLGYGLRTKEFSIFDGTKYVSLGKSPYELQSDGTYKLGTVTGIIKKPGEDIYLMGNEKPLDAHGSAVEHQAMAVSGADSGATTDRHSYEDNGIIYTVAPASDGNPAYTFGYSKQAKDNQYTIKNENGIDYKFSTTAVSAAGGINKVVGVSDGVVTFTDGTTLKKVDNNEQIEKKEITTTTTTTLYSNIPGASLKTITDSTTPTTTFTSSNGQPVVITGAEASGLLDDDAGIMVLDAMVINGETAEEINGLTKDNGAYKIGETTSYKVDGDKVTVKTTTEEGTEKTTYDYSKIKPGESFKTITLSSTTSISYDPYGTPVEMKGGSITVGLNKDTTISSISGNGITLTLDENGYYVNEQTNTKYDSSGRPISEDGTRGKENPAIANLIAQGTILHKTVTDEAIEKYEERMWDYVGGDLSKPRSGFDKFQERLSSAYKGALGGRALSNLLGMQDNEWRKAADEFFLSNTFGQILSGNWEESLCQKHIERNSDSEFYVRTPNGLIDVGASITVERSAAVPDPENGTQYLYKISFAVRNPSQIDNVKYRLYLSGDRQWTSPEMSVSAGSTSSFTGSDMKIGYSSHVYTTACLRFSEPITSADGTRVEEVCNAVTTYTGPATTSADWQHETATSSSSSASSSTGSSTWDF